MAYATVDDVKARTEAEFDEAVCASLLDDCAAIIDSYNADASEENKKIVSCRMVIRALPTDDSFPVGASQGTMSALGYSQTWTMSNGSTGELYLNKTEKKLLGIASLIGSHSPLEDL